MQPIRIFLSYAHKDATKWLDRVRLHLDALKHMTDIEGFDDSKILVGTEWDKAIRQKLDCADIIVLILTPAFIASHYCTTVELETTMRRHGENATTVVPIVADFCGWDVLPLKELQLVPKDKKQNLKTLSSWKNF